MINTKIMGVVNITPDSFYDGNKEFLSYSNNLNKKIESFKKADIIDIGCESSRPGASPISSEEEINRLKILDKIEINNKVLSIDSYKPSVIKYCLDKGFGIVNDISGGGKNFENINIAKKYSSKIILMHMQGSPTLMQENPQYSNVIDELNDFFDKRVNYCISIGMPLKDVILDPGIGFGKTIEHNDKILLNLKEFKHFKCKILVGLSIFRFIFINT